MKNLTSKVIKNGIKDMNMMKLDALIERAKEEGAREERERILGLLSTLVGIKENEYPSMPYLKIGYELCLAQIKSILK